MPTLVLHRRTDALVPIEWGRELAALIPGAKFIEYPEGDHVPFIGDAETMLGDIQEFVTGERESSASDLERILATVMFTDIVDSTRSAAEMGDQQWRRLLDSHDRIAKQAVEKHRGNLIKTTGDGILATFDGPGRAVRCALAFETMGKQIGLPLRAGLHTGEIENWRGQGCRRRCRSRRSSRHGTLRAGWRGSPVVSRVVTDLCRWRRSLKFCRTGFA